MAKFTIATLLSFIAFASSTPIDSALKPRQSSTTCATGVHIIAARGTGEAPGEGEIGSLATMIEAAIPGSDSVAVNYPASVVPTYESSEEAGTAAFTSMIESYVSICPNTKIVLLGYSQGAEAALDSLCGTSSATFTPTAPLPANYASHIVAVVTYGDPAHTYPESYDAGTSTHNGDSPRTTTKDCTASASKIRSYCDTGDPFCDEGDNILVHTEYFSKYNTAATAFVVSKAG